MPMALGIICWLPSQTSFLETMNEHFYKLEIETSTKKYILADFNTNLYLNAMLVRIAGLE